MKNEELIQLNLRYSTFACTFANLTYESVLYVVKYSDRKKFRKTLINVINNQFGFGIVDFSFKNSHLITFVDSNGKEYDCEFNPLIGKIIL